MSQSNHLCLHGRVGFVTGSTKGIGLAVATALASRGCHVVLNGCHDQTALDRRVEEFRERGHEAEGILADVSSPLAVRDAFQRIFRLHRRLDVLVNNAGVLEDALIGMIQDETLARTFAVNAIGVAHCTQAGARLMQRQGSGSIINVTSIVGVQGNAGQLAYGGSKAAVIGITKSAAKELAPRGIRVNAIAPGFIDTDMTRKLPKDKFAERVASIRMDRLGTTDDVANAALFLASDLSTYITGQVLGVDGGMLV